MFYGFYFLGGKPGCGNGEASATVIGTKIYTIHDFISSAQIDLFNMYKLVSFCQKTKLTQKVYPLQSIC